MLDRSQTTPIGLHIGQHHLFAAQLQRRGGSFHLHAICDMRRPFEESPGPLLTTAVKQLSSEANWRGRKLIVALPPQEVDIRPVRLPEGVSTKDSSRFHAALMTQARASLLYDPREAVLDYLTLPPPQDEEDNHVYVLLLASRRRRVRQYLAALETAGLHPVCVDVVPIAAARAMIPEDRCLLVVDLHAYHTVVSVTHQHDVLLSRLVRIGLSTLVEAHAEATGLSEFESREALRTIGIRHAGPWRLSLDAVDTQGTLDQESLAAINYETLLPGLGQLETELRRTARYFSLQPFGGVIEALRFAGAAHLPGMDAFLATSLDLPICETRLAVETNGEYAANEPPDATAVGLAMRGQTHAI